MSSQWQPPDRPAPYWKSQKDWYEFFHFVCPNCKTDYVIDQGSAFKMTVRPRPIAVNARWNPETAKIEFKADIICTCMVKFEINGTS